MEESGGSTGGHPNCGNAENPRVYMDIAIGHRSAGRLVFELFADYTPRTAENFRALCTGERGISPRTNIPMSYQGSLFHRIIGGFMAQGGDFTNGDGTGGESIFGEKFADENFILQHDGGGLLSMANAGPNTNGSQFFLTFRQAAHLNGRHCVFGRVESGMATLALIEKVSTDGNDKPRFDVKITNCGQLGSREEDDEEKEDQENAKETEVVSRESQDTPSLQEDEEDVAEEEEDDERAMGNMTDAQKRLFRIRLAINKGRKANKKACDMEKVRLGDPNWEAKEKAKERQANRVRWREEMKAQGLSTKESYLFETAEVAHSKYNRSAKKEKGKAAFGWDVFNQDTLHKAYEKRTELLPTNKGTQKGLDDAMHYGGNHGPENEKALERMTTELSDRAVRQKNFSRRRTRVDAVDVDYINDRNEHFNKKIKRSFDKYTIEIRQNLERGTAL